jgi:hydrogenase nickel incorporation protein HypB
VYDLGQQANVVVLSITEGEDKPVKYPVMFRTADLVLLTKVDLLPYLPRLDVKALLDGIAQVMPANEVIVFSAETGEGVAEWLAWLAARRSAAIRAAIDSRVHHHHHHHEQRHGHSHA